MPTMTIKRVGVFSVAKISGITGAGLGLILGLIYGLVLMTVGAAMMSQNEGPGAGFGIIGGLMAIVLMPIFYGVIGFVFGALYALIYNVASGFVGGIELQLESADAGYGAPPPPLASESWNPANQYQTPGQRQY